MELHGQSQDGSIGASLKATYRALLARGLETGEAANLTAFLHGLPSEGFTWTLPEIESVIQHRIRYAADQRAADLAGRRAGTAPTTATAAARIARPRSSIHDRRTGRNSRGSSTNVIDSSTP